MGFVVCGAHGTTQHTHKLHRIKDNNAEAQAALGEDEKAYVHTHIYI